MTQWRDYPDTTTPITARELNRMEQSIGSAITTADRASAAATAASTAIELATSDANTKIANLKTELTGTINAVKNTADNANTKSTTATTDTGWVKIPLPSNRSGTAKYRLRNKVCQLILENIKGMTGSGSSAGRFCTLPPAARPGDGGWAITLMSAPSGLLPVQIDGNAGYVYITGNASINKDQAVYGTYTYLVA